MARKPFRLVNDTKIIWRTSCTTDQGLPTEVVIITLDIGMVRHAVTDKLGKVEVSIQWNGGHVED